MGYIKGCSMESELKSEEEVPIQRLLLEVSKSQLGIRRQGQMERCVQETPQPIGVQMPTLTKEVMQGSLEWKERLQIEYRYHISKS